MRHLIRDLLVVLIFSLLAYFFILTTILTPKIIIVSSFPTSVYSGDTFKITVENTGKATANDLKVYMEAIGFGRIGISEESVTIPPVKKLQ